MNAKEFKSHLIVVFIVDLSIIILGVVVQLISGRTFEEILKIGLSFWVPVWTILIAIPAAYLVLRIFFRIVRKNNSSSEDIPEYVRSIAQREDSADYGIKINYPTDGSTLKTPIEATGTYETAPTQNNIYAIEFNPQTNEFWPKKPIVINPKDKTWSSQLNIGGGEYKRRRLVIAEVSPAGKALIDYFRLVGSPGNFKGIPNLDTGIKILDYVNVTVEPDKPKSS